MKKKWLLSDAIFSVVQNDCRRQFSISIFIIFRRVSMPMLNHATIDTFRASFDSFPDKKTERECLMIWAKTVGGRKFFWRKYHGNVGRAKDKISSSEGWRWEVFVINKCTFRSGKKWDRPEFLTKEAKNCLGVDFMIENVETFLRQNNFRNSIFLYQALNILFRWNESWSLSFFLGRYPFLAIKLTKAQHLNVTFYY